MLQTPRSLACLPFCIFPSVLLPAPSLLHLGPEDARPPGTAGAPPGPVLGLIPVSVFIPCEGGKLSWPGLTACVREKR